MKKLNVGLIGAGFMGKAHSVAYSNMPKFFWPAPAIPVFKTICDIVPEIAEDSKDRFGFEKSCTDWNEIVNDPEIDVVSVCTPNDSHAEISIAALKANKHVICEKPIANTIENAKAMADAAAEAKVNNIISLCAYQYRRVPAVVLAKNSLKRLNWYYFKCKSNLFAKLGADPASPLSWRFQKKIAGAGTLGILQLM